MSNQDNVKYNVIDYMCKTTQLYDVPNGEQIYGTSNNIERPTVTKTIQQEAIKEIPAVYELVVEDTILVKHTETDKVLNKHKTEIYVKK